MKYPYGLISDLHFHNWSAFSKTGTRYHNINNRLEHILVEFERAARYVVEGGGDTLVIAGDIFHTRGVIAPDVLIPVLHSVRRVISDIGIRRLEAIPGNHDLLHDDVTTLGNAVNALRDAGVLVAETPTLISKNLMICPWIHKITDLKATLESEVAKITPSLLTNADLVIHAPIDGVIQGIPPHGLDPSYLAGLGFKRVFAGHYHHHYDFGNGVYMIGAATHQTFSDVGTLAGFMLVYERTVKHVPTNAPLFVDLEDPSDMTDVKGNYVRVRMRVDNPAEADFVKRTLLDEGAAGVVVHPIPATVTPERSAHITPASSLRQSLSDYMRAKGYNAEIESLALSILERV